MIDSRRTHEKAQAAEVTLKMAQIANLMASQMPALSSSDILAWTTA